MTLGDQLGGSERLFSSPVPLFYTKHTARYLTAWITLLPFALYDPFASTLNHAAMIPCAAILSVFLFGIEELSIQLEERELEHETKVLIMIGIGLLMRWCLFRVSTHKIALF